MQYLPNPFPIVIPFILWLILGPHYIGYLKSRMMGQYIREDGPKSHQGKSGTPTMGGLLLLICALLTLVGMVILNPLLFTPNLMWAVAVLVVFCLLGFSDDYLKITKKKNKGVSGWTKLAVQTLLGLMVGSYVVMQRGGDLDVFGLTALHLGWAYPIFATLVITGASNAYNLTDGLDGLAGGTGFMTFMGLAFLMGDFPGLSMFSVLLAGSCMGFLWFNRHPAKIFMGDTGSLALGGAMGALAVLSGRELYLLLLGGIYVIETLSVMLQVFYFKMTKGKRLFKMSPIHHHFELSGWSEPTVVMTFTLTQAVLSIVAVLLYRLGLSQYNG